jgi:2-oxoisovalerate dehydrogenase E1 component
MARADTWSGFILGKPTVMSPESILKLYRTMQIIRQTEEELARCHQRGLVHGACHTYVGQEAIAAAVCAHLGPADSVFSTHRGHGHALAKGLPPHELMAELFGRVSGCSRGRGGSMHLFAPEIGMMGTSGIVGPCILQACGGGYSSKILGNGTVAVAFFGDGAVNNGAFHEGLNMASIWKLPVLFVCENNQFATEVPFSYASGIPQVGRRAASYGMEGVELDGNDAVAIAAAAAQAVARARAGQGPTLLECRTYRTRAHSEGMGDFTYRTREEVEQWKTRCPLLKMRTDHSHLAAQFAAIDAEVAQLVAESRNRAEADLPPRAEDAATHVYSTGLPAAGVAAVEPDPGARVATWSQAVLEALSAEMARNPAIFVMGEGIGKRGGNFVTTKGLYDVHGADRLCDTPICERGFVGLACGAGMTGTRPVIDFMFADFILDAVGEIINQIAKMQYMSCGRLKMPVLLRGCIGVGHSAATHHSGSYYSMYGAVPGLRVAVPSNAYDAKGLLLRALRCDDPVMFLEHRELLSLKCAVPSEHYEIEFGRGRIVRAGTDLTVVALARMVHLVQQQAESLQQQGISVELIDPRTVSPLDTDLILKSVEKTGRLLIVEETPAAFGLGAEVAARVADAGFDSLDAPIRRVSGVFAPTPYSPALESAVVPDADQIAAAIRQLMQE